MVRYRSLESAGLAGALIGLLAAMNGIAAEKVDFQRQIRIDRA